MKTFIPLFILVFTTFTSSGQEPLILKTEIKAVTVFTKGAQVFRTGKIDLPQGKSTIQLNGLSPDIDPKSIQIKASDAVVILSIAHQLNQLPKAFSDKAIDSLNFVSKKLDLRAKVLRARLEVINRKTNLLNENTHLASAAVGVSIDQLEKAIELYEKTFTEFENEKIIIGLKLDSVEQAKAITNAKLLEIRGTPVVSKSEINLIIKSERAEQTEFEVSYVVKSAGWYSRYDIRAKDISKPVQLIYKADVYQQTGEIWKNVKLKFSNGSPYSRQTAPELASWKLNYLRNTVFRRIGPSDLSFGHKTLTGRVTDQNGHPLIGASILVVGTTIGTVTDFNGQYTLPVPLGSNYIQFSYVGYETQAVNLGVSNTLDIALAEGVVLETAVVTASGITRDKKEIGYSIENVDVRNLPTRSVNAIAATTAGLSNSYKVQQQIQPTIVIENQIVIEFELEHPATVLSDGKITNLELLTYDMQGEYLYEATPKADPGAYLIAILNDWEKYHLREGEANLFFNNTFIGKTIINPDMLSDTLELSLGRDPEILIERQKVEEYSKKNFLGSTTIAERSFKISIRNKKIYPVQIQLSDQIPVSVNEAITVTETELSGGTLDKSSGIVKWRITLQPGESKDLYLNYSVKYPTKERIALE